MRATSPDFAVKIFPRSFEVLAFDEVLAKEVVDVDFVPGDNSVAPEKVVEDLNLISSVGVEAMFNAAASAVLGLVVSAVAGDDDILGIILEVVDFFVVADDEAIVVEGLITTVTVASWTEVEAGERL